MICVRTEHNISDMLTYPENYIDEASDELILQIYHEDTSNPVSLLLGYDDKAKFYYFVLEDNDIAEDFYCKDGDLMKMYNEIFEGKGEYEIWVKG